MTGMNNLSRAAPPANPMVDFLIQTRNSYKRFYDHVQNEYSAITGLREAGVNVPQQVRWVAAIEKFIEWYEMEGSPRPTLEDTFNKRINVSRHIAYPVRPQIEMLVRDLEYASRAVANFQGFQGDVIEELKQARRATHDKDKAKAIDGYLACVEQLKPEIRSVDNEFILLHQSLMTMAKNSRGHLH